MEDVEITLVITIGLVVIVIFMFLRDIAATAIPAVTVPLSLVGTFGIMYMVGFSLNNLSLMALTIATGFVVDDAIVMIENIARYVEEGEEPFQAALKGAKQIGFTIVSLTVSLVCVLIPLLFMGGIVGRLFREFAVTLAAAIGVSALLSLTLTPMMTARLLRPQKDVKHGKLYDWSENAYEKMVRFYDRGLVWVLAHRATTLAVTIATVLVTVALFWIVPKGFFPRQDTGLIIGITEASSDSSFSKMMELQQRVADLALADDEVANVASFIGSDGTNPTSTSGRLSITLKSHGSRKHSADEIAAQLGKRFAEVPGIVVHLQSVQDLQVDARVSGTAFQYTLEDANVPELKQWAHRMQEELTSMPELAHVTYQCTKPDGPRRDPRHRPRHGRPDGHQHAGHRRHALRRVRPASDLDHLHPAQHVPRHPRGHAEDEGGPRGPHADLRARHEWRPRAALGVHALRARQRARGGHARGAVSVGHALVRRRRGARRSLARRSTPCTARRSSWAFRRASTRRFRALLLRSSRRSRASRSSSSPRSSPSTSSSASSTRATSTPSPFSRRCRRQASAPPSR